MAICLNDLEVYKAYLSLDKLPDGAVAWDANEPDIEGGERLCRYPTADGLCGASFADHKGLKKHIVKHYGDKNIGKGGRKSEDEVERLRIWYEDLLGWSRNGREDEGESMEGIEAATPDMAREDENEKTEQIKAQAFHDGFEAGKAEMQGRVDELLQEVEDLRRFRAGFYDKGLGDIRAQMLKNTADADANARRLREINQKETALDNKKAAYYAERRSLNALINGPPKAVPSRRPNPRGRNNYAEHKVQVWQEGPAVAQWQANIEACFVEDNGRTTSDASTYPVAPYFDIGRCRNKCPFGIFDNVCQCGIQETLKRVSWSLVKTGFYLDPNKWPESQQRQANEVYEAFVYLRKDKIAAGVFDEPKKADEPEQVDME